MHKLDVIVQARNSIFAGTFFLLWRHEHACRRVKLGSGYVSVRIFIKIQSVALYVMLLTERQAGRQTRN